MNISDKELFQAWLDKKLRTARQDETARAARVPYKSGSGGEFRDDLMKVAKEAYEWSPLATIEDLYKAYKDPSLENVGWAALGAMPGGRQAKKLAKLSKSLKKQRKERDWQDIPLSYRGKSTDSSDLTRKFLDEHGYSEYRGGKRDHTYEIIDDPRDPSGVKTVVYTPWFEPKTNKKGVSKKTFKHPTLKSLRDWAGY
tara:strand:+ start:53 stop:646 length:594 start_codon:yes stop_codon:yes gene_type:complete